MRTIKLNSRLSFAVYCVLVSFIVPVTALAADCPCFTAEDVMRFASQPEKFVCLRYDNEGIERILVRGQYFALFSTSAEEESRECYAGVMIIDVEEILDEFDPKVVLLNRSEQNIDSDEWYQCDALLTLGDPPECDFDWLPQE